MPKNNSLQHLSSSIEHLKAVCAALLEIMDQKIRVIISSDLDHLEHLTEELTDQQAIFRKAEEAFIEELKERLGQDKNPANVRLEMLLKKYPESSETIRQWIDELQTAGRKLEEKHKQLGNLLRFAMSRNVRLMQSIYSKQTQQTTHYNTKGDKQGIISGVAINQQA